MQRRDLLLMAAAFAASPAQAQREDPVLAERLASLPKTSPWPNSWFQPREVVRGGGSPDLVNVSARGLDAARADQAWRFAEERQSDALVVVREGRTVFAQLRQGFDPALQVNSYHMHWLPLVLAIGVAIDRGAIGSVDDPVGRYLPEWRADPRGAITLRNLLSQSAGLRYYQDSSKPADLATHVFFGSRRAEATLAWPQHGAPGQSFEYNYIVAEVLGLVLERATRRRYADFLSAALWRPMRLPNAEVWLDRPGGAAYHNAGMFAPPKVFVDLGALLADGGRFQGRQIVSRAWIDAMRRPSATNPNFGFIWLGSPHNPLRKFSDKIPYAVRASEPYLVDDLMLADGYIHRIYASPQRRAAVIVIGTSGKVGAERRNRWDDAVIPNLIFAGLA